MSTTHPKYKQNELYKLKPTQMFKQKSPSTHVLMGFWVGVLRFSWLLLLTVKGRGPKSVITLRLSPLVPWLSSRP